MTPVVRSERQFYFPAHGEVTARPWLKILLPGWVDDSLITGESQPMNLDLSDEPPSL